MSEKIYNQLDLNTIEALADIVRSKDLGEITIVDGGKQITVKGKKTPPPPPPRMPSEMPPFPIPAGNIAPPFMAVGMPPVHAADENETITDGNIVKAPIVGTFYCAPAPGKPPFVSVGQQVKKGDVLMIIESMKLMNEIQSEFDGTVTKILVKDGQMVEYDQPIMIIG